MLTEAQQSALDAVAEHGTIAAAAAAMGKGERSFRRIVKRAKAVLARQGVSPEHDINRPVPEILTMSGLSDMRRNSDGLPVWYKFREDREKVAQLMREAVEAMREEIRPAPPVEHSGEATNGDLLNLFVLTDYHLGSRSWPEETKDAPWDTAIAEDMLVRWFQLAIESSPKAQTAVLAQLGDFLDHDGQVPVTPTSGHVMDADSRFQKMVRIAIQVLRRVIAMLLVKHERVHVIMAEGNHDIASSVWLREAFHALYENEPRVTVDRSPDPYYCYEHGKTSLFLHHGHLKQPKDIDSVFVAKFRDVFGRTKHSFAHLGHKHHIDIKETNLMLVEQHRTLSARNSHESRGGWISGRDAKVVTYHKEFGRVAEQVISPEML